MFRRWEKESMQPLNPTLWRTCRVLAGVNRLRLLRRIFEQPGQNVSQLANHMGIGVSDASQELRRLQSRGLLRRTCQGKSVVFLPLPDPQVPSAAPLLKTLKSVLPGQGQTDESIANMGKALGHERRIALTCALLRGPRDQQTLSAWIRASPETVHFHLNTMIQSGWVVRTDRRFALNPARPLLMKTLLRLLRPPP
ncbi:MAG: MarR family transcriptional regulator [Opitutae bacterium]|nr:MarR family transcriptional regulator [Opitutae bacterium]